MTIGTLGQKSTQALSEPDIGRDRGLHQDAEASKKAAENSRLMFVGPPEIKHVTIANHAVENGANRAKAAGNLHLWGFDWPIRGGFFRE